MRAGTGVIPSVINAFTALAMSFLACVLAYLIIWRVLVDGKNDYWTCSDYIINTAVVPVALAIYVSIEMVWMLRRESRVTNYQVRDGMLAMMMAVLLGSVIILSQLGVVFG